MCEHIKKLDTPIRRCGYKIVIVRNGDFISPFTGITYTIGKVPTLSTFEFKPIDTTYDICSYNNSSYKQAYRGLTAVFERIVDAKVVFNSWRFSTKNLCIIEMEIIQTHSGIFSAKSVFIGNEILSIKQIKIAPYYYEEN